MCNKQDNDRWVQIVDPKHILRVGIDEEWHPAYGTYGWKSEIIIDGITVGACAAYKFRCRLCDVPDGIKIVDPGPDHELVEPWVRDPNGGEQYWDSLHNMWLSRTDPSDKLTTVDIYRRPTLTKFPDQFAANTAAFRKAHEASKTPQPGEWWFANNMVERLFFHGRNQYGQLICESCSGVCYSIAADWSSWHHEPDCTSWDWQPTKPEAQPEELQTYNITVPITDREREVLLRLSGIVDLPPERVMVQALRHYQTVIEPVNPPTLASANSEAEPEPLTLEQRLKEVEGKINELGRLFQQWEPRR